ncbi:MAG: hypothetical protein HYW00_00955, partial [Candidatus Colwellbacteria bacterium]|nr:hypothetical protein [Candidatus Colwellbacteria bacterium]
MIISLSERVDLIRVESVRAKTILCDLPRERIPCTGNTEVHMTPRYAAYLSCSANPSNSTSLPNLIA